jgi:probable addiction module antidote protein
LCGRQVFATIRHQACAKILERPGGEIVKKKTKVSAAAVPYEPQLLEDLKDIKFAAGYLNSCIDGDSDEDFEVFFNALGDIVKAQGVTNVAKKLNRTRDTFYKAFSKHRNPTIRTLREMLHGLDLEIAIVPKKKRA